jgi:hypothetical protein
MNEPSGLFIDSGGNIISADSRNDRLQVKKQSVSISYLIVDYLIVIFI